MDQHQRKLRLLQLRALPALQKLQLLLVQLLLDQHQREPRSVYLLWPTRGKASIVAAEMFDPFHNKCILGHNRQCADVTEPHCLIQDLQPHMKLHILYSQHRLQSLYPDTIQMKKAKHLSWKIIYHRFISSCHSPAWPWPASSPGRLPPWAQPPRGLSSRAAAGCSCHCMLDHNRTWGKAKAKAKSQFSFLSCFHDIFYGSQCMQ